MKIAYISAATLAIGSVLWIASGVFGQEETSAQVANTETVKASNESKLKKLITVRVMPSVAKTWNRQITLFGRTEAIQSADVKAETVGNVAEVLVNKGDVVKKGDVILKISTAGRYASLDAAKANMKYRQTAYDAAKKLSKKNFQSKVRLAEELALLEAAKGDFAVVNLDLMRTSVRAPISGIVNELPLSVGDYATKGAAVATVVALNSIRVVAEVSERDISLVKPGNIAHARFPDGRTAEGLVLYISKKSSELTRTFRIDVWLDNEDGSISEGMTTELKLSVEASPAHRISSAVLTLNDEGMVGVKSVSDKDIVEFHKVRIVADTPEGLWVDGLPGNIRLITVGQEYVIAGQQVGTREGEIAQ